MASGSAKRLENARIRAQVVRILDHHDATTVLGNDGVARRFEGDSAALVRAVLDEHASPCTRGQLIERLSLAAGGAPVPEAPVDELLALLERAGVLVPLAADAGAEAPARATTSSLLRRRVLLGVTGAVAALDAPLVVRGLLAAGCDVQVALTRTARRFVAPDALAALLSRRVFRGLWDRDAAHPVPHINLAEWAELVLVCPASATSLARLARGDASDLVSAIVCATRAPVVIVPSMNESMRASPGVQRNLETLRGDGRYLVHEAFGVEVAHRPEARVSRLGPAAPAGAVVDLVRHVLAQSPPAREQGPWPGFAGPGCHPRQRAERASAYTIDDWERVYAEVPAARLPWWSEDLDADTGAALDALAATSPAGARRLVDLGTGPGQVAIAAAERGFSVTATDIAPSALALAKRRAGALPILFVLDDVTASTLPGGFDVAHDRGLLHVLPRDAWPRYADQLARLVAPGGTLLLKSHDVTLADQLGTTPVPADELRALLDARFTLERMTPSTFPGPGGRAPAANLFVFQRRLA